MASVRSSSLDFVCSSFETGYHVGQVGPKFVVFFQPSSPECLGSQACATMPGLHGSGDRGPLRMSNKHFTHQAASSDLVFVLFIIV